MNSKTTARLASLVLALALAGPAGAAAPENSGSSPRPESRLLQRHAQSPLPRCVLYSSTQLTPQGLLRCSYQCGDRIVIHSSYNSCPSSVARPAPR